MYLHFQVGQAEVPCSATMLRALSFERVDEITDPAGSGSPQGSYGVFFAPSSGSDVMCDPHWFQPPASRR